jgi:hypothetical protein
MDKHVLKFVAAFFGSAADPFIKRLCISLFPLSVAADNGGHQLVLTILWLVPSEIKFPALHSEISVTVSFSSYVWDSEAELS